MPKKNNLHKTVFKKNLDMLLIFYPSFQNNINSIYLAKFSFITINKMEEQEASCKPVIRATYDCTKEE